MTLGGGAKSDDAMPVGQLDAAAGLMRGLFTMGTGFIPGKLDNSLISVQFELESIATTLASERPGPGIQERSMFSLGQTGKGPGKRYAVRLWGRFRDAVRARRARSCAAPH